MQREPFDPADFERIPREVPWVANVLAFSELASTNDEAARLARDGAPEGTVVVADVQTAGRGRLDRQWVAEPGVALLASWLVRSAVSPADRGFLPLAAGVAVADAIERVCGVATRLKWPNDVLASRGKLAGILCEALPDRAVVVGVGVNVRQDAADLPIAPGGTSLLLERSRPIGRARLLAAVLEAFAPFAAAPGAALTEYRRRCDTLGRDVRVERAGADPLTGRASAVRDDGALVVVPDASGAADVVVTAGDVVHLRPR